MSDLSRHRPRRPPAPPPLDFSPRQGLFLHLHETRALGACQRSAGRRPPCYKREVRAEQRRKKEPRLSSNSLVFFGKFFGGFCGFGRFALAVLAEALAEIGILEGENLCGE